jgi:hypothetical protein
MTEHRSRTLGLFRQLMRAGGRFSNYNFREYALRRVRLGFRESVGVTDESVVQQLLQEGEKQLEMTRRQATISQLYPQKERHVMEHGAKR